MRSLPPTLSRQTLVPFAVQELSRMQEMLPFSPPDMQTTPKAAEKPVHFLIMASGSGWEMCRIPLISAIAGVFLLLTRNFGEMFWLIEA